jgi:ATP-binding cassette subfamily F protein 3
VRVLSGGERTRLAVARMLLRPSNLLLLDEPTNHLDLDSKEVLLDALVDYGGTLIFVSHDRYFVERLATKIIEIGRGEAIVFPGTYKEFLWHKEHREEEREKSKEKSEKADGKSGKDRRTATPGARAAATPPAAPPTPSREERKKVDAEARKKNRAAQARQSRIAELESRIAECEATLKALEQEMAAPGFYDNRATSQPIIDKHQALMWKVGDLMHQWEELNNTP